MNGRTDIGLALEQAADSGPPLLLDGATGTELERRGVEMVDGLWDALATGSRPDVLREIHADYLRAGSQVVIANTFSTSRYVLAEAGHGDRFESLNRNAVRLAVEARDEVRSSAWVAGSISTLNFGVLPSSLQKARQDYRDQAEIMAAAGADLIILEMMRDVELTAAAVDAVETVDLPCWVGYSVEYGAEGQLVSQEQGLPLQEMLASLDFGKVQVVGVMHSPGGADRARPGGSGRHLDRSPLCLCPLRRVVDAELAFRRHHCPRRLCGSRCRLGGRRRAGGWWLLRFGARTHPRLGKGTSVALLWFAPTVPAHLPGLYWNAGATRFPTGSAGSSVRVPSEQTGPALSPNRRTQPHTRRDQGWSPRYGLMSGHWHRKAEAGITGFRDRIGLRHPVHPATLAGRDRLQVGGERQVP